MAGDRIMMMVLQMIKVMMVVMLLWPVILLPMGTFAFVPSSLIMSEPTKSLLDKDFVVDRRRRRRRHVTSVLSPSSGRISHHVLSMAAAAGGSSSSSSSSPLKPASMPLMDSGKAVARSGELLIDLTQNSLALYGGALSACGAQIRNAGDCLAQAAASCRFKTGAELVCDELREAATCMKEASDKMILAREEAKADDDGTLEEYLVNMVGPLAAVSQDLEAAGAAVLTRQPLFVIGGKLIDASIQLEQVSTLLRDLSQSTSTGTEPYPDGILSAQRMAYGADRMRVAGLELTGGDTTKPKSKGKAWLKG